MWRAARKSDYGTADVCVFFCAKMKEDLWKIINILVQKGLESCLQGLQSHVFFHSSFHVFITLWIRFLWEMLL